MADAFTWKVASLDETRAVGRALGQLAGPGLVVGLTGSLGTGKTTFTRAVAEGLEVDDSRIVTSPTFVLVHEYEGRLPLYHFDTYRLKNIGEFLDLGVDEYFFGEGVCLVEWADRVRATLPEDRIELTFTIDESSDSARRIDVATVGARWRTLALRWRSAEELSELIA